MPPRPRFFARPLFRRARVFLALLLLAATMPASAAVPRPEHPRPDAYRTNWVSLNGEWQFEIDRADNGFARGLTSGVDLAGKILVPFAPESRLSGWGLGNTDYFEHVWYRRHFALPPAMAGRRVRLHFGAVDYQATVYVNGQALGTHTGGSAAFQFEITRQLQPGTNELVVRVVDALRGGLQAGGKQAPVKSEGGDYTRTTGIWQPVWLEAVGDSFVESFSILPDPDHARVLIEATLDAPAAGLELTAEAFAAGLAVGADTTPGNARSLHLVLNLAQKRLWNPGAPFLYDLRFTLRQGGRVVDTVDSYFGLRKVTIAGRRILINDQPVFQRLVLDQGFYPAGNWTAPSDAALRQDIELSMAAGFNGARLHQKVFEPRFLYWADRLGYLVWGEFPNSGYHYDPAGYANYLNEWTEVLQRDRNHPAIIGWCPFNETSGRAAEIQQLIWRATKAIDTTRPVLECSGWSHSLPLPEVRDAHDYESNPSTLRARWRDYFAPPATNHDLPRRYRNETSPAGDCGVPFMISETGGIGWGTEGGWGYGETPKSPEEFYTRYQGVVDVLLDNPNLFGFCYTQLTDIEQERNGIYYYDRQPKLDLARLHQITARAAAYERGETQAPPPVPPVSGWRVLTGAAADGRRCTPWQLSTNAPPANWTHPDYAAADWATGIAPFGREAKRAVQTAWTTPDLYLRKTFEFPGGPLAAGALVISHGGPVEVFLNGQLIYTADNRVGRYFLHDLTPALRTALHSGPNILAVHARQHPDGQFIDLGLLYE